MTEKEKKSTCKTRPPDMFSGKRRKTAWAEIESDRGPQCEGDRRQTADAQNEETRPTNPEHKYAEYHRMKSSRVCIGPERP